MVERSDITGKVGEEKNAGTPAGVQDLGLHLAPVVSSLTLLNHRLLAVKPPASVKSGCLAAFSIINQAVECAMIHVGPAATSVYRSPKGHKTL